MRADLDDAGFHGVASERRAPVVVEQGPAIEGLEKAADGPAAEVIR